MDLPDAKIFMLVVVAVLAIPAVYTDLRFGKIYNFLTLPGIAAGLFINLLVGGWTGLGMGAAGVGLVLLLYMLFAPVSGIGGGDIKLLMALAALLGVKLTLWMLAFTGICGGVIALIVILRHRRRRTNIPSGVLKFRYSPAIAIGALAALLLG